MSNEEELNSHNIIKSLAYYETDDSADQAKSLLDGLDDIMLSNLYYRALWQCNIPAVKLIQSYYDNIPESIRLDSLSNLWSTLPVSGAQYGIMAHADEVRDVIEAMNIAASINFKDKKSGEETAFFLGSPNLRRAFNRAYPRADENEWSLKERVNFTGDLPIIDSQGVLHNPELAIGINNIETCYPESFDHVLCWVSNKIDKDQLPRVEFYPYQNVEIRYNESGNTVHYNICDISDSMWRNIKQGYLKDDNSSGIIPITVKSVSCSLKYETEATIQDCSIIKDMLTLSLQHGFDHKAGHTLSRVSAKDILSFPISNISTENTEKASAFLRDYLPIDIIANSAIPITDPGVYEIGFKSGIKLMAKTALEAMDKDPDLKSKLLKLFPRPAWDAFTFSNKYSGAKYIDCDVLINMWKHLEQDNKGITLDPLGVRDIEKLYDINFVFSGDSKVIKHIPSKVTLLSSETVIGLSLDGNQSKKKISAIEYLIDMGVWPIPGKSAPQSIDAALKSISRTKDERSVLRVSLDYYLKKMGVDRCVKAATTDRQWDALWRIFGSEISHEKHNPSKRVTRKIFKDDLGL